MMRTIIISILALLAFLPVSAQEENKESLLQRIDSKLTENYRKGGIDTTYITRPQTKWTVVARINVSGAKFKTKGMDNGRNFNAEMEADRKATLSLGVSYLGFSVNLALNPGKLLGKYHDYELNFNSYGKKFGFDFIYQDAKNFKGWHDHEGLDRIELPDGIFSLKTLNLNAYYVFNGSRFSYPAAMTQSYIQRRSAGSFLLGLSAQGQHGTLDWEQPMDFKMTNIGIGGGYGYNYVPSRGWLLHISAMPTFIVYSNTSLKFGDIKVPLHYHFPEAIITGRGAVVRQWGNKFFGISMVSNFTSIGHKDSLAVHNIKWRVRTFFGIRL